MKKKLVSLVLTAVLSASALTACGSSNVSSSSSNASASSISVESLDASATAESNVSAISDSATVEAVSEAAVEIDTDTPIETTVMYSTTTLNIRATASTDADIIGTFATGDSVTVISSDGGWSKVDYDGTEAYVSSDYLSEIQPTAAAQIPASSDQQETMVWVSATGKKYHSRSGCSNMSNPSQISKSDAQAQGYEPCKKCY